MIALGVETGASTIRCVVSGASFSRASGISWADYYEAIEGRPLRPLFVEAVAFLPSPDASDRARVAVDLDWHVFHVIATKLPPA